MLYLERQLGLVSREERTKSASLYSNLGSMVESKKKKNTARAYLVIKARTS